PSSPTRRSPDLAGHVWRDIKIEGSIFTGREPDENRYDFDRPRFDSYSGRLSWNPTQNLALQVSYGYIKSPEALEPDLKRHRTTASIIYNLPLGHDSNWSNTFAWARITTPVKARHNPSWSNQIISA